LDGERGSSSRPSSLWNSRFPLGPPRRPLLLSAADGLRSVASVSALGEIADGRRLAFGESRLTLIGGADPVVRVTAAHVGRFRRTGQCIAECRMTLGQRGGHVRRPIAFDARVQVVLPRLVALGQVLGAVTAVLNVDVLVETAYLVACV